MGKLAILLVLCFAGIAISHSASSGGGLRDAAAQAGEKQRSALARTAAKTGWQRAKHALVASFTSTVVEGANGAATYRTVVDVTGSEAVVTSVGRVPIAGRADTTTYRIVYRLRSVGGAGTMPEFAEHALVVDGDLTISGNGAIVEPGTAGSEPVRVHTNGRLTSGSGSVRVQGFGSYTGSAHGRLSDTFQPVSNPDGEPALQQRDSIRVPTVVPSEILATYGGYDTFYPDTPDRWDYYLRGTMPGGTREDPLVYYSPGSVLLDNVTFDGYAIVVTDGDVHLTNRVRATPDSGLDEVAMAVYSGGIVEMTGGAEARTAIFAEGGVNYRGNVDIWGNLMIGGDFDQGGGATIHYVPAPLSLFGTWSGSGDPALDLIAYREQ